MSRVYGGLWRALLKLDAGDSQILMQTEPPSPYEDVERYLWEIGQKGYQVEGLRVKGSLMVEVVD